MPPYRARTALEVPCRRLSRTKLRMARTRAAPRTTMRTMVGQRGLVHGTHARRPSSTGRSCFSTVWAKAEQLTGGRP